MECTVINDTYTIQSTDIYELKKYRKYFMGITIEGELQYFAGCNDGNADG